MTYPPVNSMKLNPNQTSIPPLTSEEGQRKFNYLMMLNRPQPPTPEAVEKAQFKDKTYRWNGR